MDHVAGSLHILLAEKEGRVWFKKICLKCYQFERTIWWCMLVMESILEYVLESVLLEKNLKKLGSPIIFVRSTSWRWAWRKFR